MKLDTKIQCLKKMQEFTMSMLSASNDLSSTDIEAVLSVQSDRTYYIP